MFVEAADSLHGVPAGLGDTVFNKLDANLSKALMSIGAVKCVEIGDGIRVATTLGSEDNDGFTTDKNGNIHPLTNHAGGILGGMSDGADIILRASFKATPSILKEQHTVTQTGQQNRVLWSFQQCKHRLFRQLRHQAYIFCCSIFHFYQIYHNQLRYHR